MRTRTHQDDVAHGEVWARTGADSEWAPLRRVMLTLPDPRWSPPADWNAIQYLAPVAFGDLHRELSAYADLLAGCGVQIDVQQAPADGPHYNAVFARDQFLATYAGAVVARMASTCRRGEERLISARLTAQGHPVLRTISGGCFEAADALWVRPGRLLIGQGRRTDAEGARQVAAVARDLGAEATVVPVPSAVQHLLGIVQVVGPDLALLRKQHDPSGRIEAALTASAIRVVEVPEHPEIVCGQAMNLVTLDARTVVIPRDRPAMSQLLAAAGIEVHATVPAESLIRCGGGLACATGILLRDRAGAG
ncbi:hypothetical protein GCM10012284_26120 [Mangrovihabitans endophyticus]|uniref:N-Dimethylarginine dimethylaminohydrolase n=1 Tax=Mangrovihabitans endophyticus TaxID=1751298 RepID=A0A8J3BY69_9ACTN|nr:hypothetical protein GCM10012284_26120 [Mangrovihabitans endophyticus]